MLIVALLLALLVGVSLGMLGGGGSILTVPILRYVLGMEAHEAIATSLLVVGTTSVAALASHARRGRVKWRTGLIFGLAGMTGAYVAGRVAHYIPATPLLIGFGVMMIATAIAMLRAPASRTPAMRAAEGRSGELPVLKVVAEGLVVGAVTGLVGAGGGFLVVPALVLLGGMPINLAIGTSLLVIAMKSFAGFAGFLGHTPLDWALALPITGVALAGSFVGSALSARVEPQALRQGFGWFVVAMAFFILAQEVPGLLGRTPSVLFGLAVSVVGTLLVLAARRLIGGGTARPPATVGTIAANKKLPLVLLTPTEELGQSSRKA